MSPSTVFIRRPVATILLTFGIAAAGAVAFFQLPVSPLPQVDFPTISVRAQLPGASPEVVATTVATPHDVTLQELHIEVFYPADAETEIVLQSYQEHVKNKFKQLPD